jgi:uncharacterized protein (TIGR01319 family)
MATALLIDFGSTFTKVTAVDLDRAAIVGRAQSPSTVDTDVCDGLLRALGLLHRRHGVFDREPDDLRALNGFVVRACSSAAGGLRIVVVGLVPGLTVAAGNAAALGAGGKIVGAFGFKLGVCDLDAIAALRPDVILLTGGTDGGDAATILHNAALLARSPLAVPFVVAGNAGAAAAACAALEAGGKDVSVAANVMARAGVLSPQAAQEEIRRLFMRRIVDGKGLDGLRGRVPVVLPTPMAVQQAAVLGSQVCGELMLADVGGATTDIYSISEGKAHGHDAIPQGLPEPVIKRTVEGDLGVRWNADSVLERVGADTLASAFRAMFPELQVVATALTGYIRTVSERTGLVPAEDWQLAADATLAKVAIDLAIERHAGRREPYYARGGRVFLQHGKDLSDVATLIGTGGIFTRNRYAGRILTGVVPGEGRYEVLRPADPAVFLDRDYVLYAVGLLAENYPAVAQQIFTRHVLVPGIRFE